MDRESSCSNVTVNRAIEWAVQPHMLWQGSLVGKAKGYIQQYELVSLPRCNGRSSPRPLILLVVLTQVDLCPKFPGQTGPLVLLCSLISSATILYTQEWLGYVVSQCSYQLFLTDGVWSQVLWGRRRGVGEDYDPGFSLGGSGRAHFRQLPNFSK